MTATRLSRGQWAGDAPAAATDPRVAGLRQAADRTSTPPGRPTLVNVWATWCPPCVEEVPELAAFAERAGDRVGLVGVLMQDSQTSALELARQFGMRWPSVVDDQGEVFRAFRPGPPVTLFLDAEGRVVHKRSGKFDDVAEIEQLVQQHLGVAL